VTSSQSIADIEKALMKATTESNASRSQVGGGDTASVQSGKTGNGLGVKIEGSAGVAGGAQSVKSGGDGGEGEAGGNSNAPAKAGVPPPAVTSNRGPGMYGAPAYTGLPVMKTDSAAI
jgi:hypothetical protein